MIRAQDLIAKFLYALANVWGYILGTAGILWTADKQAATDNEMAQQYGEKWIGHYVADCSGLFVWAFKQLGRSIYHGSNTIWNKYLTDKGRLNSGQRSDGKPLRPGTAVFLTNGDDRHHIGLYIGNGEVIEAKGTAYGVVKSGIDHWDEWGELKNVDYYEEIVPDEEPLYLATVRADNGYPVRMRTGPNENSMIIDKVPLGTVVEVYDVLDGWSKIGYEGQVGYMMTKFLVPVGQDAVAMSRADYESVKSALKTALDMLDRLG